MRFAWIAVLLDLVDVSEFVGIVIIVGLHGLAQDRWFSNHSLVYVNGLTKQTTQIINLIVIGFPTFRSTITFTMLP